MRHNLKLFLIDYSIVVFLTILLNFFIRIGEYWYVSSVKFEAVNLELFFSKSINFDTLFIVLFSLIFIVPLTIIAIFRLNIAKVMTRTLFYLLILVLFILTEYFLINNSLLSSTIFEFSLIEIINIGLIEISSNRTEFLIALFVLLVSTAIIFFKSNRLNQTKIASWTVVLYLIIAVVSLINKKHTFKPLPYFNSYNHFLLGNSKPVFLIKTYYESLKLDTFSTQQEIKEEVIKYQDYFPSKNYNSLDYPLMNNSEYENVLGSYFKKGATKPNVVIIISESLSASFSGNNLSIKKSLTPFTDSLANNGLSWNNFLSNAERSYGVLPNLLASLPSGTAARGFINMDKGASNKLRYPKHNNLINILNNNDYKTSYFYGGAGNFDNVAEYMSQIEINNCITIEKFDTTKYNMDLYARSKQAWGYKDGDLYNQGLDNMDTIESPYLSIFQTLSNHTPFNLSDDVYYTDEYLQEKLESLGLNRGEVKKIDQNILSSIFYADDALKSFFKRIKQREDYENTIFIITGDHAIDLNIADHAFENYHIPFIIYSPLLKKTAQFNSVNSHVDVLPSILSLLKNNYNVNRPLANHWIGEGLKTDSLFKSNQFIPLCISASDMPNVIIKENVLFAGGVYQINENLGTIKVKDSSKISDFMNQLETYRKINNHVCKNNLIED